MDKFKKTVLDFVKDKKKMMLAGLALLVGLLAAVAPPKDAVDRLKTKATSVFEKRADAPSTTDSAATDIPTVEVPDDSDPLEAEGPAATTDGVATESPSDNVDPPLTCSENELSVIDSDGNVLTCLPSGAQ